jgi:hypothetical protein
MILETAQKVNSILSDCGCCQNPLAPEPRKECQSKSATASSADDNYTDDLAEWSEKKERYDAYQDWLDADPEDRGEPPPNEPDPGPTPEKPAGYDDKSHGSWVPFIQPEGDPADSIPVLYREFTENSNVTLSEGTIYSWLANPATSANGDNGIAAWETWSSQEDGKVTYLGKYYRWTSDSFNPPPNGGFNVSFLSEYEDENSSLPSLTSIPWVDDDPPEQKPCTANSREFVISSRRADAGGSAADLSGNYPSVAFDAPFPDYTNFDAARDSGWPFASDLEWSDLKERESNVETLGSSVTKEAVKSRAESKIPEEWPDPVLPGACNSTVTYDWPAIGSILGGADPEADPPVEASWPECESEDMPISRTGFATVTKARYRMGIPNTDNYAGYEDAHDAWVLAKAEWDAAPPAERGPEPIEPVERSYYSLQWDEVFFPRIWSDWKVLKDAFDAAEKALEEWEADESEDKGDPPEVPEDPGEEPTPKPSLVASRDWTYTGGDEWSEWYEIEIPEIEGETRVVNQLAKHYRSTRLGTKPTLHGEVYEMEEA